MGKLQLRGELPQLGRPWVLGAAQGAPGPAPCSLNLPPSPTTRRAAGPATQKPRLRPLANGVAGGAGSRRGGARLRVRLVLAGAPRPAPRGGKPAAACTRGRASALQGAPGCGHCNLGGLCIAASSGVRALQPPVGA